MTFWKRLSSFDDNLNFRRAWRFGFAVSGVLLVLGVGSLLTQGLRLGIDFKGGTVWDVPARSPSTSQARDAMKSLGEGDAIVQVVGSDHLRVEAGPKSDAVRARTTEALARVAKVNAADIGVSTVGPSWGNDVSQKALKALIAFFIAIAAYISLRLEWRMAVGAVVAVVHDLVISVGIYSLFQLEVTPGTVIAFLTILGYSLYDTIVVYDKVADNTRRLASTGKYTYGAVMNLSLNQVIVRSLNTTVAALLPVISILVIGAYALGAVALEEFGLALLIGLFVGAYSSVFIASPIVAALKEREPRYRQLRQRLQDRPTKAPGMAMAGGAGGSSAGFGGAPADEVEPAAARATTNVASAGRPSGQSKTYSANHPPRPRKKGKKR